MWKSLPLLLGLAACHGGMGDMGSMRGHLGDMRRETTRHLDASLAAASMVDMRAELRRHGDGMMTMMSDLEMTMDDMAGHCSGLSEMIVMHAELDGDWALHLTAMDASDDLVAATAEVKRHASAMHANMDEMDTALGSMACM